MHGCGGGMHGFLQGVYMVVCGGCAWLRGGSCMVAGGACMVAGGMHGYRGACVVVEDVWLGGVHGGRGDMRGIQRDTVNERVVRILLECILV